MDLLGKGQTGNEEEITMRLCCMIHKTYECMHCKELFCVECWIACNKVYGELNKSFVDFLCSGTQGRHVVKGNGNDEEEFRFAATWAKIMVKEKGKIKEFWNEAS